MIKLKIMVPLRETVSIAWEGENAYLYADTVKIPLGTYKPETLSVKFRSSLIGEPLKTEIFGIWEPYDTEKYEIILLTHEEEKEATEANNSQSA